MRLLSVFDLDHTLLTVNSSYHFGVYLYHQNFFSFFTALSCLKDFAAHKYLSTSLRNLHINIFFRLFKGCVLENIEMHVNQFLDQNWSQILYLPAIQRLQESQMKKNDVLILSSSPDFLVGNIAHRLKVNHWKSTSYQVDIQGKLLDIDYILDGEDKANYVKRLAFQLNFSLEDTTAYSDSYLDLPLLNIAGKAVGVRPDRQLKRICLQKGWEIL